MKATGAGAGPPQWEAGAGLSRQVRGPRSRREERTGRVGLGPPVTLLVAAGALHTRSTKHCRLRGFPPPGQLPAWPVCPGAWLCLRVGVTHRGRLLVESPGPLPVPIHPKMMAFQPREKLAGPPSGSRFEHSSCQETEGGPDAASQLLP